MIFFQSLFYNQYTEISGRGGNGRKAQLNTIILSTVLITLYLIVAFVVYGQLNPGHFEKIFSTGFINGKAAGRVLAVVIGLVVFFILKFSIGSKAWYDKSVDQYNRLLPEEQKRIAKKGIRYFFIASLPVIIFIVWGLVSVF